MFIKNTNLKKIQPRGLIVILKEIVHTLIGKNWVLNTFADFNKELQKSPKKLVKL